MAGQARRSSRHNFDDPFDSTAVPGAKQQPTSSSTAFSTPSEHHGNGSNPSLTPEKPSTPSPKDKPRNPWNGEYLYVSTPRRGPHLETISPIPLEYDQPIAETTPSASSDEYEPDVTSPLFGKSVEALRKDGWGAVFQQRKQQSDAQSSEAETEIQEADAEAGPRLLGVTEVSFDTQTEPALAFLKEPSTAREFDAGLLLGKINFNTTSASARAFNRRCIVGRIKYLNDCKDDRAHNTAATPRTAVQAYKATGDVRKVGINKSPSINPLGFNQRRLKRKGNFEVQRDAGKAVTKREAPKKQSGCPRTDLKDMKSLPLRAREQPGPFSLEPLKSKPNIIPNSLQKSQSSLPDVLKAGYTVKPESTESFSRPPTASQNATLTDAISNVATGSSRIPHPSPVPGRSFTPAQRAHKSSRPLPIWQRKAYLSPDRGQAISYALAALERRAPPSPPPITPPLVRHARDAEEDYSGKVQLDSDELMLHHPMPIRGRTAMREVMARFEKTAAEAEEKFIREEEELNAREEWQERQVISGKDKLKYRSQVEGVG